MKTISDVAATCYKTYKTNTHDKAEKCRQNASNGCAELPLRLCKLILTYRNCPIMRKYLVPETIYASLRGPRIQKNISYVSLSFPLWDKYSYIN